MVIFVTSSIRGFRFGLEELVNVKFRVVELEGMIIRVDYFEVLGKFYM